MLSLWKLVWQFLKKLKIGLPYDPTIIIYIGYIQPIELEAGSRGDTCA
jgi:hypothetical protein